MVHLIRDCVALAGLTLVTVGTWAIYWPAALIVAGLALLLASLWGHLRDGLAGDDPGPK